MHTFSSGFGQRISWRWNRSNRTIASRLRRGAMSFEQAATAARFIEGKTKLRPQVGLVLGSGLGAFADELENAARIPFGEIPRFPVSSAEGHAGKLVVGTVNGVPLAAMQGRVHFYEGHNMQAVTFPMRVFKALGVHAVILTNAAGGISEKLEEGCLVVLTDH